MTGIEAILTLGKRLYGEKFEIKEGLVDPYRKIFNHFISGLDEKSRNKGVGLVGAKGLSKSSIMRIMHILFKDTPRRFMKTSSQKLYLLVDEGFSLDEIISMYVTENDLYIDDIGIKKEDLKKVYGNSVTLISEILNLRYEMFVNSGYRTHWSSNLPTRFDKIKLINQHPDWSEEKKKSIIDSDTLETVLGERIVDRLMEMDDIIIFKGESLR